MMEVVKAAGVILFRKSSSSIENIEYLLMKASYGSKHWSPPKGHVDPGESELETALRETKEECGFVDGKDYKIVPNFKRVLRYRVKSHIDGIERPKETVYFLGRMLSNVSDVTLSEEHTDFKWVSLKDAVRYADFPDFLRALQECEDYIRSNEL